MTNEDFDVLVGKRVQLIQSVLLSKAKEYAQQGDRLHNFKVAARVLGTTPEKALMGMAVKHFVSVLDLVEGKLENKKEMVDEKCLDLVNYIILLIAILEEGRNETN